MNKENNKGLLIAVIFLSIIVCLLGAYIIYDKLSSKDINNNIDVTDKKDSKDSITDTLNGISKTTLSGTYNKGYIIHSSESGFIYDMLVLNDTKDYVTVLVDIDLQNISDNNKISDEEYQNISNEYFREGNNSGIVYDNTKIKQYVESKKSVFSDSLELKQVDGYEIRLAKVEELLSLDSDYQEQNNQLVKTWTLKSANANKEIMDFMSSIMTMTSTNYSGEGKIANFYTTGNRVNYNTELIEEYFITTWSPGVPAIKPVLNIVKK